MISLRNSNYLTNFKYLWKNVVELEATVVSGCNEQTPPQNNISGSSSISVINTLKDRISFLEIELSKKALMIDYISNELITSKRSKSQDSINSSQSANIYENITMVSYANDTIKETINEKDKSAKKSRVIITGDSLLNVINEKGLSKDNRVTIKKFLDGTTETILEELKSYSRTDLIPLLCMLRPII